MGTGDSQLLPSPGVGEGLGVGDGDGDGEGEGVAVGHEERAWMVTELEEVLSATPYRGQSDTTWEHDEYRLWAS